MLQEIITAHNRLGIGKGSARKLRNDNMIPGVLYSEGSVTTLISLDRDQIRKLLIKNGDFISFPIELDGNVIDVSVKDVQRDPVTFEIIHIDLMPANKNNLH